ncbi:unnamed protein product, partial [Mesorhabditis belari]|uniref:1-phosphatidylinositol-3-phosphate 5-kinase n=1 Tax=Mesorhabditis belari TaxID=2138241 RepID=A0AAF3EEL5_9BILA
MENEERRLVFLPKLDESADDGGDGSNATTTGIIGSLFGKWWGRGETVNEQQTPTPSTSQSAPQIDGHVEVIEQLPSLSIETTQPGPLRRDNSPSRESLDSSNSNTPKRKASRIASYFRREKAGLVDYDRSSFRQYWMPDSTGRECYQCEEKFTAFRRKHHCRLCGQIFCAKCCNAHVPGAPLGYIGDLRLCSYCVKMVEQHLIEGEEKEKEETNVPQPILLSSSVSAPETSELIHPGPSALDLSIVSAGSLMWSAQNGVPQNDRKDSLSLPPLAYRPPSMLSVEGLFSAQQAPFMSSTNVSAVHLSEEEAESGPDWVRNMDLAESGQALKSIDSDNGTRNGGVHFDLGPITIDNYDEVDDVKPIERKESISHRTSLSPESSDFINENDVDKLFEHQTEMLIDYLFQRAGLNNQRWRDILLRKAKSIASKVVVDVFNRKDNMNILQYVHVKTLHVDETPNAELIWGIACTKSVTHSSMCGELPNASVMLMSGSIEYERVTGKLSNLEPIINQETEYLSKQVERILARRPSLLLVENNVSKVAAELLRVSGVRLVTGVKKEVLQRIGRATGADLIPSGEAQLIQQNQNVGFCPYFDQRGIRMRNGEIKHILIFDQCSPDRGCSVLLRGNSFSELKAVKKILKFLVQNLYSSKLEKAFLAMHDCKLAYTLSNCKACEPRRENIESEETGNGFLSKLRESVLSSSPYIEFEPPFLETPKGKACSLLPYFKQPLYQFTTMANDQILDQKEQEMVRIPSSPCSHLGAPIKGDTVYTSESITSFRSIAGMLFKKRLEKRAKEMKIQKTNNEKLSSAINSKEDVLDPFVHQRVAILFGSYSPKSPNAPMLCVRPWVVNMQFYASNDMTLGEFLTKFCFNKDYQCPSTNCELSMMEHSRKMVYGRVCVEVTTSQLQHGLPVENDVQSNDQKRISSYHYCEECRASSPIVFMDVNTWHLSFARFLDYIANASFSQGSITSPNGQPCLHCYFHQQSHFFAFNNYITCFKVSTIQPYHVQFSPVVCNIQPSQIAIKSLEDLIERTRALSKSIFAQATERLTTFSQNEYSMQLASQFHTTLRQLIESTKNTMTDLIESVDVENLGEEAVASNSIKAIKVNDMLIHVRAELFQMIQMWNEQCSVLGASVRAMKRGEDGGGNEIPEVSIERLEDPFPSCYHLTLPLHPRLPIVVRDIQDSTGAFKPDIGSIIAYALGSKDYEEGRTKSRETMGEDNIPLNLSAKSMADGEEANRGEHVEVEFQDSHASFYVKAYYAERFRLLRKLLFPSGDEAFIRSLSTAIFWTPQGGKSGAFFYRTQDQRFVIKQMSKFEVQSFVKFAPRYFEYIKTAATEKKLTTLCKVYGVFRVGYKHKLSGMQIKVDVLVMEYLFYKRNVSKVWDLKGSLRNRLANTGKSSSDLVLMDENFIKDLWNSQLYVFPHSKAALNQAISNDSHFLSAQHVMDYSLLVGVDESNGELILGIVDYMRTYTLDKKFESWVKIVTVPGAHLPTVISPQMYCTRFSEAIDTYFPVVPDQWTGLGSTMSY